MDESASEMASPSEEAGASDAMTSSCEEGWQSVDLTGIQSSGDLDTVVSELDQTFQDCDTLSDWLDQASTALPMLDSAELESWAETRCSEDTLLSDSPVCAEISS